MIRATFYCNIYNPDGELVNEDFDFDCATFDTSADLDKYIKREEYVIGQVCGYWGEDTGILTNILTGEVEDDA